MMDCILMGWCRGSGGFYTGVLEAGMLRVGTRRSTRGFQDDVVSNQKRGDGADRPVFVSKVDGGLITAESVSPICLFTSRWTIGWLPRLLDPCQM